MKICQKCGGLYTDDNMFCGICGLPLVSRNNFQTPNPKKQNGFQISGSKVQNNLKMPEKKKANPLFFLIPIFVVLVILAMLFLFWDKFPFARKMADTQESIQQQGDEADSSREKQENPKEDFQEKQENPKEKSEKVQENPKEDSGKEKADGKQLSKDASGVEINGVDNAYVLVAGIVAREEGNIVLKLEQTSSVCAYDGEEQIVQKENVDKFALDGADMEEYLGDKVEIKGKLSVDFAGDFLLEPVKTEVKQQAQENVDSTGRRYQLIKADVTWQEAAEDCIRRGGYLAQINSEEEYRFITDLIENENMKNVHFYLGGRRAEDSWDYYWVNADNSFAGEILNPEGQSWAAVHWMEQEPSFTSESDTELYMNLIYYQESWVFNDVPLDITVYYPGKTGYICEFDE